MAIRKVFTKKLEHGSDYYVWVGSGVDGVEMSLCHKELHRVFRNVTLKADKIRVEVRRTKPEEAGWKPFFLHKMKYIPFDFYYIYPEKTENASIFNPDTDSWCDFFNRTYNTDDQLDRYLIAKGLGNKQVWVKATPIVSK